MAKSVRVAGASKVFKNSQGRYVETEQKLTAYDVYLRRISEGRVSKTKAIKLTASEVGLSECLMWNIVKEVNDTGGIKSTSKKRMRSNMFEKLDVTQKNTVRSIVNEFFEKNEIPTIKKVLQAAQENESLPPISKSSLWRLLKQLGFGYNRKGIKTESEPIDDYVPIERLDNERFIKNEIIYIKQGNNDNEMYLNEDIENDPLSQKEIDVKYETTNKNKIDLIWVNHDHNYVKNGVDPISEIFENSVKIEVPPENHTDIYTKTPENRVVSTSEPSIDSIYDETGVYINTQLKCSVCTEMCSSRTELTRHVSDHNETKTCNICSEVFTSFTDLKIHYRFHTGERAYKCKYCDKSYDRSPELKKHNVIHTGIKSYKCKKCNRFFYRRFDITKHDAINENCCGMCDTSCDRSSKIKYNVIHPSRSHRCWICNRSFTYFCYLKRHFRKHRKIQDC